jgi:hypothetical protein
VCSLYLTIINIVCIEGFVCVFLLFSLNQLNSVSQDSALANIGLVLGSSLFWDLHVVSELIWLVLILFDSRLVKFLVDFGVLEFLDFRCSWCS